MATVYQKIKRQQILIILFFVILLITISIWYFYGKGSQTFPQIEFGPIPQSEEMIYPQKVEIDFGVLENPFLKELELFEKIEPLKPEEMGRENPFFPY